GQAASVGRRYDGARERARGGPRDGGWDISARGRRFYPLLSGRLRFDRGSAAAVLAQIAREDPPRLVDAAPHVPRPLAVIVDRMMARQCEDRYQDIDVILAELASYERRGLLRFSEGASFVPLPPPTSPRVLEGETQPHLPPRGS